MLKTIPRAPAFVAALVAALTVPALSQGLIEIQAPRVTPPDAARPDDGNPLLTPDIRPNTPRAPDKGPETTPRSPEGRSARPKDAPKSPPQKDAQPDPKATPKTEPKSVPGKSAKGPAVAKPGLAVAHPRTPAERDKALADLYAYLATAEDAKKAETIAASIERLWVTPGSDTISLLMQRAMVAANSKNPELALKLLDSVVELAPDYSEAWNRRAYVHYQQNQIDLALGDLRRTLALDPNHFKALDGLIHILRDIGRKKEALAAARKLLDVDPFYEGAQSLVDELQREVEGRGI